MSKVDIKERETRIKVSAPRRTILLSRGVTYGSFRPNDAGVEFHDLARNGINTVRIQHTTPSLARLDLAVEYDSPVMVGMSAEQHIGHLLKGAGFSSAVSNVRSKVHLLHEKPVVAFNSSPTNPGLARLQASMRSSGQDA